MMNKSIITKLVIGVFAVITALLIWPFGYNDPTERTLVTRMSGEQLVVFTPGMYYSGIWSRETKWPNQISVAYTAEDYDGHIEIEDNTAEIGLVTVRFNDATEAQISGITQYMLPGTQKEMLEIHNAHKTPESLVLRRLAPYTKECLQSSAQLLSSEMHYSGGRAQMVQDYLDQLRNGTYLLSINEGTQFDSLSGSTKRTYTVTKQISKNGQYARKFSSIKEYEIALGDAQITNTEYSDQVKNMLKQKIEAATQASISKQKLTTAEQQRLTAKAQGEQKLTEIEYQQKVEQTKQVVAAETQVLLAKEDLKKQEIARQAAEKEAAKIKVLADAEAYAKQRVMAADGALEKKLATYEAVQSYWADAFAKYQGNLVPTYQTGATSNGGNGGLNFMELMSAKAAKDLSLDLGTRR